MTIPSRPAYPYPCATGEHRGHRSRMMAEACLRVAEEARMREPVEGGAVMQDDVSISQAGHCHCDERGPMSHPAHDGGPFWSPQGPYDCVAPSLCSADHSQPYAHCHVAIGSPSCRR